jgi:shikimate dehydrogenase
MKLFGLTGNPLNHSLSKLYFDLKFIEESITDCHYELFPVAGAQLIRPLADQFPELAGLNVTAPFKQSVIQYLDKTDSIADRIGAVNCIKVNRTPGKPFLTGYNTDSPAFRDSLKPLLKPHHTKALILGTGGAAQAVKFALEELNIPSQFISRTKVAGFNVYEDLTSELLNDCTILVNATPVGMFPAVDSNPEIPYQYLTERHLLYDLVYNPELTMFLQKGIQLGATVKNGLEMLHRQAELAWQLWNSVDNTSNQ